MSLEKVFEAWYDKCRADCSVRLGSKAQEWVVWNAGYEAAKQPNELGFVCGACDGEIELDGQEYCEHCLLKRITELEAAQQWIPYKDGDVVEDGWYAVTYANGARDFTEHDSGDWWCEETVIAYCHVPAPFVPEV